MVVDRSRAKIKKSGFQFTPLRPSDGEGQPLSSAQLRDAEDLIVFERGGERRALVIREMAYHHLAQGTLAGEPYLISF
jgi:hypothetical protein